MAFTHNSTLADSEPDWGTVDKTRLPRIAFADMGEEDSKSTWRFPHHWVQGGGELDENGIYTTGTLYLHRGGLAAARSAAAGGRSGQPASEAVRRHLAQHAEDIGMGESQNELLNQELPAQPPEWVMLARVGEWRGHPSGVQTVTREDLASALAYYRRHYQANHSDLVIDYHHASTAAPLVMAPAAGWISDMELREGGSQLWGRVLWTAEAAADIAARRFRYLSPVFSFGRPDRITGEPVPMRLHSVALTNTPFLTELPALNEDAAPGGGFRRDRKGLSMNVLTLLATALGVPGADVAKALGIAEASDDEAVANAIMACVARRDELEEQAGRLPEFVANDLQVAPDADQTTVRAALLRLRAPNAGMAAVRGKLGLPHEAPDAEVLNAIAALQESHRRSEAEELVDKAIQEGRIPPSTREWWLNAAIADIAAARATIESMPPIIAHTDMLAGANRTGPAGEGLTDADVAVMKAFGFTREAMLAGKA